jgi:hypothetical protein
MRPEEVAALGDVAGDAAAGFAVQVREMHKGIAQRAFKAVGGIEHEWTTKVRHVFTPGAPHRGAPLEQLTHAASAALSRLPETRGFAKG